MDAISNRTDMRPRRISLGRRLLYLGVLAFLAITVAFMASRWLTNEDLTTAASTSVLPVSAVRVEAVEAISTKRFFTGRVAAQRASDLAFERSAEVDAMLVEEGERVSRGQPLARLDARDLAIDKRRLEAQLGQAQARLDELKEGPRRESINAAQAQVREFEQQLELAQLQSQRRGELLARQAISQEEFDRLEYQSRTLKASLDAAKARLEELETGTRKEQVAAQEAGVAELEAGVADIELQLEKSVLRAPFHGRIAERAVDEGVVVSPGQTVLRIVEDSRPEVRIGLPVEAAERLEIGVRHTVSVGSKSYQGKVKSVLPELEAQTRTATVLLDLPTAASSEVFPGQIARLEIEREQPAAGFWLPTSALTRGVRGLWACYALAESEEAGTFRLERRQVEVLYTEGDRSLVRGTLEPGDRIVESGVNRVTDGQRVRLAGV